MKKVGLFGGAFDPPTLAHLEVAKQVLRSGLDEVWFCPCNESAYGKQMVNGSDRLRMLELMVQDEDGLNVCGFEIDRNLSKSSHDVIVEYQQEFEHQLYFVIGMDNANRIHTWGRYQELIEMIPFIVVARGGSVVESEWFLNEPHRLVEVDPIELSSSIVRDGISNGDERLGQWLHSDVLAYVLGMGLYG